MQKSKNKLLNELDLDIEKLKDMVNSLQNDVNVLKINNRKKEIILNEINNYIQENEFK